jgi:hypothetical protein
MTRPTDMTSSHSPRSTVAQTRSYQRTGLLMTLNRLPNKHVTMPHESKPAKGTRPFAKLSCYLFDLEGGEGPTSLS